jgi:hypothetical protein
MRGPLGLQGGCSEASLGAVGLFWCCYVAVVGPTRVVVKLLWVFLGRLWSCWSLWGCCRTCCGAAVECTGAGVELLWGCCGVAVRLIGTAVGLLWEPLGLLWAYCGVYSGHYGAALQSILDAMTLLL